MSARIRHADCMLLLPQMRDGSVDLTLTDIPYDEVNRDSAGLRDLDKAHADVATFDLAAFMAEVIRVTAGSIYVFCGIQQVSQIEAIYRTAGLSSRQCAWLKSNPSPMNGQHIWMSSFENCMFAKKPGATFNEHCQRSVWEYPIVRGQRHPTEKSLPLFERLVLASSNPGDLVFDPCMGSGTTGEAALKHGRRFVGFDSNADAFAVAKERLGL